MTLPDPGTDTREFDPKLCSTCGEPSSFIDDRPGANPVGYCSADLPPSLQQLAAAGQLSLANENKGEEPPAVELQPTEELLADQVDEAAEKASAKVQKAASKRG